MLCNDLCTLKYILLLSLLIKSRKRLGGTARYRKNTGERKGRVRGVPSRDREKLVLRKGTKPRAKA